ncbi:hypothetical protein L226DRAFT_536869 [Lentinus tigrinus ALCF2SS1-7]|uniref:Uncharacterized protein n=1 Tax=Lentinus tigrinus ALCF2SS1-6 TaxID=1328759 RepID=A0A5C2RNU6_9APHY|nr:hypothetical protein L227DRAFT_581485 [Lentinus tigrinus ALCF2SS1-6]RPD72683.1 hypothetical protein L226DRAFT_536869 [Lentinus tigrinus ALCF2SS1-7]
MTPEWASALAPTAQPSVLSKILARDGNKCFKSGLLYKDSAGLCATPIIPSSLQLVVESLSLENAPSSLGADLLRFLANFCELDVSDVDTLHGPENRLLLDAVEGLGFAHLEWTLLPTEIPNQYKVATFTDPPAETPCNDPNVPEQGREKDTYVTFVDHSTSAPRPSVWARLLGKQAPAVPGTGIPLPSPDFLRVHATTALFMHHAGFKGSKLYPGL